MLRTIVSKSVQALGLHQKAFFEVAITPSFCEAAIRAFGLRTSGQNDFKPKEIDWSSFPPTSAEIFGSGWRDPEHIKLLLGRDYELFMQDSQAFE